MIASIKLQVGHFIILVDKIPCPCIVLCGGKSSRMGEDKAFLRKEGKTFIEYQVEKMNKIFKDVYISAKKSIPNIDKSHMIIDTDEIHSPLHAIKTILLKFENTHVFILAVDVPNISQESIELLHKNTNNNDIISPMVNNKSEPLCSFYHTSIIPTIDDMIEKKAYKLKILLDKVNTKYMSFNNKKEFININTPQEYNKMLDVG